MKEVIFHFFPSARFLGLSLKILFHKNKEIKRMLSKKMTFSLMSLITLLAFAFAFVADDAFAAEKPFEITIVGRTTVTYAAANSAVTVDLVIESAQPIPALALTTDADASNVKVTAIDRNGFLVADASITIMDRVVADYPMRTAKKRQLRIVITQQPAAAPNADKGVIAKVVIEIPAIMTTDPTVLATDRNDTLLNMSKLVQHTITLSMAAWRILMIFRAWFRSSGCVLVAKRLSVLSKRRKLQRRPLMFVLCSPKHTLQTLLTP